MVLSPHLWFAGKHGPWTMVNIFYVFPGLEWKIFRSSCLPKKFREDVSFGGTTYKVSGIPDGEIKALWGFDCLPKALDSAMRAFLFSFWYTIAYSIIILPWEHLSAEVSPTLAPNACFVIVFSLLNNFIVVNLVFKWKENCQLSSQIRQSLPYHSQVAKRCWACPRVIFFFFLCKERLDLDRSQLCGKNRWPSRAVLTVALVSKWFCPAQWCPPYPWGCVKLLLLGLPFYVIWCNPQFQPVADLKLRLPSLTAACFYPAVSMHLSLSGAHVVSLVHFNLLSSRLRGLQAVLLRSDEGYQRDRAPAIRSEGQQHLLRVLLLLWQSCGVWPHRWVGTDQAVTFQCHCPVR